MSSIKLILFFSCFIFFSCQKKNQLAQIMATANYDESKCGNDVLPDPFLCQDGSRVTTQAMWWNKRRPELMKLFEDEMYGRTPQRVDNTIWFEVHKVNNNAVSGKAIMKEIDVFFTKARDRNHMRILLFVPKKNSLTPCFVSLNFHGNHSVSADTSISLPEVEYKTYEATEFFQTPVSASRGDHALRWPLEMIIDSGYALATANYADLDPDFDDGFQNGIHPLFYRQGQHKPDSNQWGSIGAWAWGMSRMVDYLQTDSMIDIKKIIGLGHSRLGKTALWAGAQDTRFAIVISNNSGCCGAALTKRIFGETPFILNEIRPQWFCDQFVKYNHHEDLLDFDQHELIALIAPRPVYVASATEDLGADPKGEFLSALYADTVYKFLKTEGLPVRQMPVAEQPVFGTIGYHLRTGKHDIQAYDWRQYIKFANYHFYKK